MILVIGYGNPLRRDDGLGPKAAQLIADKGFADVTVLTRHQLGPELAEDLSAAEFVIFIDANALGIPGTLSEEYVEPEDAAPQSFSHHLRPSLLLSCSRVFYGTYPRAVVFSVTGDAFDHGEGLTTAVEKTLPLLVERISAVIRAHS